ncbi:MAG: cell envelope integrity protein TolA [Rudaea sp.]|uniref:cell envelope integrity protein TolA n=1 Tax=unclassified Rudaea TaxID=2627037 RepID=UPI0014851C56|nr:MULTISPECIES: cell envelope integrity protein TolA [unclassified Rudaea]MBN8886506.1 cell envelope integrity protein TolA [Rudaea sp.]
MPVKTTMETSSDKARAYLYALLVHLGVFASLFLGLIWVTPQAMPTLEGPIIEAEFVGKVAAPKPRPVSKTPPAPPKEEAAPPPEPKPAPPPPPQPEKTPPPTVQKNDNRDQEKIAEMAMLKAQQAKKAEEEKVKQKQIELQKEEERKEAEQREKQQQIQKQLEDIRKERAANDKKLKLAQQKMQQLDDLQKQQSAPPPVKAQAADVPEASEAKTGMNGTDTSLLAEYSSAIIKVVTDNWNRPDTTPTGVRCAITITQIPGGTVINTTIGSPCNADMVTQNSIKQAVTKAQPLPYKGYESVFQRNITFIFKYDGT